MLNKCLLLLSCAFVFKTASIELNELKEIDNVVIYDLETHNHLLINKKGEIKEFLTALKKLNNFSEPLGDIKQSISFYKKDILLAEMSLKILDKDSIFDSFISKVKNQPNWFHGCIEFGPYYGNKLTFKSYNEIKNIIKNNYKWDCDNSVKNIFPTVCLESTEKYMVDEERIYNKIVTRLKQSNCNISKLEIYGSSHGPQSKSLYYHKFYISFENMSELVQELRLLIDERTFYVQSVNVPNNAEINFWFESSRDSIVYVRDNVVRLLNKDNIHIHGFYLKDK